MVEVVTDETDAAAKDEQTVESTDLDVLVRLLGCERTRVAEEVDEADSNATVDVEDELRGLSEVDLGRWRKRLTVSFFDVVTFSTASA